MKHNSPWLWVPTLYFTEGIPYFLVNSISVMLFAKMGVPNDQLSFFTTLLYFPWFLKGLWSPFVDILRTKRWWIVSMQALISALCILLTLTLPHPSAEMIAAKTTSVGMFRFTLILFIIAAFASATHDIAADGFYMLAHDRKSQAAFVGIRSTFYRIAAVFSQGVIVYIAGYMEKQTGDIPFSWQVTLGVTSVIMLCVTLYHSFFLPRPEEDKPRTTTDFRGAFSELGQSFASFFTKPGVGLAIGFMLLYRLSEGFLVKLSLPFLVDSTATTLRNGQIIGGGLGLNTDTVGVLYGTIGVICLLLGGILGGIYISRKGLKRSLWLMAAALTLPSFVYCYLSMAQPESLWLIGTAVSFEQFGYGFGFTAYMMYMMHFSEGAYKTSHYAICTAFMALSMMIPGFIAGSIELAVGYSAFFWIANSCSITTFIITYFVYKKLED
ncbi:MAG: MFS transporter [Paludibacteraceae bacterium]|jgi:PAT family beta-lactamase induction signal transducer AmpG|nr:MFS transporter [Paludibacteraceae bacterium]